MGRDHIRYLTRQFYPKLLKNHFYLPKICLHNANGPFVFRKLRNTVSAVCLCSLVTKLGGAYLTKKNDISWNDRCILVPTVQTLAWFKAIQSQKSNLNSPEEFVPQSLVPQWDFRPCFVSEKTILQTIIGRKNFLLHTGYFSLEFPGSSSIAVLEKLFCLQILRAEHYWFS